jgi:hypothetical protein
MLRLLAPCTSRASARCASGWPSKVRRVRRLYPGGERTINIGAPGGFNLVWEPGKKRRFVFESYDGRVFGIKSGVMPWVKWQECA